MDQESARPHPLFSNHRTWRFPKICVTRRLESPARSIERNPWLALKQLLIARMVLFDDVIRVKTGSTSAPAPRFLRPLKFRDYF